jgi:type II secretory pathway pseudopilin PulG
MSMRNRAMTLLEILIATALFSAMLVLVIEAMMNLRGLASTVEDMDILEEQAARAKRAITRDFANSGWFYCHPGANGRRLYPQIHLSDKQPWQPLAISPETTVTIPLTTTTSKTVVASVNQNRASLLGDAIVFTRLQPEGVALSDRPVPPGAAIVDFKQALPQRLDQFANARPVQSLVIDPDAIDQPELTSVVWETSPTAAGAGLGSADLYDDNKVRLFCYRVVPDPVTGRGQLIRYYSNPGAVDRNSDAAWEIDEVIATDVVGMRIYSFEMAGWYAGTATNRDFTVNDAAGLTNNQIRFFIDFARNLRQLDDKTAVDLRDRGATTTTGDAQRASTVKTVQFTVSLRSITNSLDQ